MYVSNNAATSNHSTLNLSSNTLCTNFDRRVEGNNYSYSRGQQRPIFICNRKPHEEYRKMVFSFVFLYRYRLSINA